MIIIIIHCSNNPSSVVTNMKNISDLPWHCLRCLAIPQSTPLSTVSTVRLSSLSQVFQLWGMPTISPRNTGYYSNRWNKTGLEMKSYPYISGWHYHQNNQITTQGSPSSFLGSSASLILHCKLSAVTSWMLRFYH